MPLTGRAGPLARVGQYARRDFVQVSPDELLERAQERLADAPAAVVVAEGQVTGMVSQVELLRLAELLAAHPQALPRS